jgi:hypothetical protein
MVNSNDNDIITKVLGLIGGVSLLGYILGNIVMMLQMGGDITKGLSQMFSSYIIPLVLVLAILAIIASLLYSKNKKIFSIVLLIAGVLPILVSKQLDTNFLLLTVAGIIGLVSFIKGRKNQTVDENPSVNEKN